MPLVGEKKLATLMIALEVMEATHLEVIVEDTRNQAAEDTHLEKMEDTHL